MNVDVYKMYMYMYAPQLREHRTETIDELIKIKQLRERFIRTTRLNNQLKDY